MGQKYGIIGDQRRPYDYGEQVVDPTKILGFFEKQNFPYTEQNTVEGNIPFITPNINLGTEDGKYSDRMNHKEPLRSVDADSKPGPEKWLKFTSETIKVADKNPKADSKGAIIEVINITQENVNINSAGK
ncbi:hypothetical protein JTB14_016979 [Gonioctena quinquepunctata]|nr:hypothetical protein JTB14_016979 [Gonioctena quinquepunctata]